MPTATEAHISGWTLYRIVFEVHPGKTIAWERYAANEEQAGAEAAVAAMSALFLDQVSVVSVEAI